MLSSEFMQKCGAVVNTAGRGLFNVFGAKFKVIHWNVMYPGVLFFLPNAILQYLVLPFVQLRYTTAIFCNKPWYLRYYFYCKYHSNILHRGCGFCSIYAQIIRIHTAVLRLLQYFFKIPHFAWIL